MVDALSIFNIMEKDNIIMSFKGEINSDIITRVLQMAEDKLDNEKNSVKKKIYNILVEGLQNLYHHTEDFALKSQDNLLGDSKSALLLIWYEGDYYYIQTGNYILNENIAALKERLDKINAMTKDELRDFYKEILNNNHISEKGGASLGMIDIARKSGEKLDFQFTKLNNDVSFFDFKVKVKKN